MGWKIGTKGWVVRNNQANKKCRLVHDKTIENAIGANPVNFIAHAVVIIPGKSLDTRIDRIVCKEYATKILGKDEDFFNSHVLHHDLDGTRMYVDKKLHQSRRHLGYGYVQLQKARKELGLI